MNYFTVYVNIYLYTLYTIVYNSEYLFIFLFKFCPIKIYSLHLIIITYSFMLDLALQNSKLHDY